MAPSLPGWDPQRGSSPGQLPDRLGLASTSLCLPHIAAWFHSQGAGDTPSPDKVTSLNSLGNAGRMVGKPSQSFLALT